MKKEIWECNECGSPCRIEIYYSDEKLPQHLVGQSRFKNRACPCQETVFPVWKEIFPQAYPADEITLGEILQCPRCQKTGKAKIFRR